MFIEEKIIQENIISKDHINEIYHHFVILTENSQFKIIPLNFINVFHNINEKKDLKVDKEIWNQIFLQIDYDKDGAISFQDFLRYVYINLKIILGEGTEKSSINKINYLTTYKERQNFHSIISTIFFQFVNIINPFKVTEAAKKFQPVYSQISLNLDKNGQVKPIESDSDLKFNLLKECLEKLNDRNYLLMNFINSLNNSDFQEIFQSVLNINKILKPFSFVSNHFEILNLVPNILVGINNLAENGTIQKLFYLLDNQIILTNIFIATRILKIFKKIINISTLVIELHNYSKFNEMNFTKNLEIEILNLNEFIDVEVIPKIISRLNLFMISDNFQITHACFKISLLIAKKNLLQANTIFSDTNFLNSFFQKFEKLTNPDSIIIFTNSSGSFNFCSELRKYMLYCVTIVLIIDQSKQNNCNFYVMISSVLNKLTIMAESLKNIFFAFPDPIFQYYFLIFLGLITKRNNFDNRNFISKVQDVVMKNYLVLAKPYIFYIKNMLNTKFKTDTIFLLVEFKTLEFFDSILEANKNEEYLISEFLEILEIIVLEHKADLITSSILKDIMMFLQKLLRYHNYHAVTRKVMFLLKELAKLKDSLVDGLIDEFEIFSLVCKSCVNYKFQDDFFLDFYQISKINYDTPMLSNAIFFLTNTLQSEIVFNNSRSSRNVNINNISPVIDLFNSLFDIWNTFTLVVNSPLSLTSEIPEEILIFEKYKHLTDMNFPNAILDLIRLCKHISLNSNSFEKSNNTYTQSNQTNRTHSQFLLPSEISFDKDKTNYDCLISFLEANCKDLEEKCRTINEFDLAQREDDNIYDECYDELYIYTQSTSESEKELWTPFKFSTEDLLFPEVINSIQEHYNLNLNFYFFDEKNKIYTKIKDENDFYDHVNEVLTLAKAIRHPIISMKLLVDDADKNGKIKYICNCVHCGRVFELDVKEVNKEPSNLCEICKNLILSKIATTISLNNSMSTMSNLMGSPYKNMTGFQTPYNFK